MKELEAEVYKLRLIKKPTTVIINEYNFILKSDKPSKTKKRKLRLILQLKIKINKINDNTTLNDTPKSQNRETRIKGRNLARLISAF